MVEQALLNPALSGEGQNHNYLAHRAMVSRNPPQRRVGRRKIQHHNLNLSSESQSEESITT